MKRRTFLSLASVTPVMVPRLQAEPEDHAGTARAAWAETVVRQTSGTFISPEGDLRLEVALITKEDEVIEETVPGDGGPESQYTFRGEKLPRWLQPTDGILKVFRFTWKGREVPVAKRFWNDFGGCLIDSTPLKKDQVPEELHPEFDEFLNGLEGPKVILSADGGTALIEWRILDTDACCGHRATVRWIIGKGGAVMRHRHTTPNMC
ncbi:hypothetical protein OKA05_13550 [Luteolibacter arcticus]|uniref:Lipoprotein n=1 Tax=Luteolibacter arcticus TaxID=1581411 RepID=A0ABT3GJ88_9BACT|nr:hypothetical protein [Luteolibacter arcticus]MCW1923584.1 hypothetical protein [Luteolibacter arcticus]